MDAENTAFANTQNQFYHWASEWIKTGYSQTNFKPDVIEIVSLFQIIGFKIRYVDFNSPHDITPLEDGGKGVRISLSCGNSGLRANLELEETCRCPQNVSEVKKWEVSGTEPNKQTEEIKETGYDVLLPISSPTQKLVSNVLTHLFNVIIKQENDGNQNIIKTPIKPAPVIKIHSPEIPMSPARYRSLDTLTKPENVSELPEPGALKKMSPTLEVSTMQSCSSPNLASGSKPSHTSSPIKSNEALYNKLKTIKKHTDEAIALLLAVDNKLDLNFDISKIKESTESIAVPDQSLEKNNPPVKKPLRYISVSHSNLSRSNSLNLPTSKSNIAGKPAKLICRRPIRSCSDNRTQPGVQTDGQIVRKSLDNVSSIPQAVTGKPAAKPTVKKNNYSHVKSTIPKCNLKK